MWLIYLGLAAAIIGIGYGISIWSFNAFLEDQGIYLGEDGHYHYRVMPSWAIQTPEIDVIASEPRRVVIHKSRGVGHPVSGWYDRSYA